MAMWCKRIAMARQSLSSEPKRTMINLRRETLRIKISKGPRERENVRPQSCGAFWPFLCKDRPPFFTWFLHR